MKASDASVFANLLVSSYRPKPGVEELRRIRSLAYWFSVQLKDAEAETELQMPEEYVAIAQPIIEEMLEVQVNGRAALPPSQSIPLLNILETFHTGALRVASGG